jgi:putative copper export protein
MLIAAARGLHMAGSFALLGTCGVMAFLVPARAPEGLSRSLKVLAWGSFLLLLLTGAVWFVLETVDMAGARDIADVWAALPVVATSTRFGELLIGRCVAAALAVLLLQCGFVKPAAIVAGLAVVAEAWLDHGGAMTGPVGDVLLVSAICHLACGGAWLGALPGLRMVLKRLPMTEAAHVARQFSPVGMVCVAGLTGSAVLQFIFLIGSPRGLFNNNYGLVALFKIALLVALVGLAAANRYRMTPAILAGDENARRRILRSVGAEIALGLLALLAAGFLLQMTPPAMAVMLR